MSHEGVDATIRALADPGRRAMLDALRRRDGQTVTELGDAVPDLGRHAVLKHLGVLESAGLVTTRKAGRQRFVRLNPVPVVELAQRWLDDYAARAGLTLTHLKQHLETKENVMTSTTETRTVVATIVIEATPERVWAALTDPEQTAQWYYGTAVRSTFEPGAPIEYFGGDVLMLDGEVIECVPNERLVHTFRATWDEDVAGDPASRYEWRLEPMGDALTRVTVEHSGIPVGTATAEQVEGGTPLILSALKTLLETGRPLPLG